MKILLQRVSEAAVTVRDEEIAAIGPGLLGLVGFGPEDGPDLPQSKTWRTLLKKVLELRIFPDESGKLNLSVQDYPAPEGGEILLVSQFTLYADCRKGRRPSFHNACAPDLASELFTRFADELEAQRPGRVRTGAFGEEMHVSLVNWGPVTIMLSSEMLEKK